METLFINGGRELVGSLEVVTAKNALLPIMAGSIISGKDVVIHKTSKFSDVLYMSKILESLGVNTVFDDNDLYINSCNASGWIIKDEFTKKIRSSIFMLGPLLSRFRKAKVAYPGGCNIGNRPINLHLIAPEV